jgi:hypothetical protein
MVEHAYWRVSLLPKHRAAGVPGCLGDQEQLDEEQMELELT